VAFDACNLSFCPQDLLENDNLHNGTDASGNPIRPVPCSLLTRVFGICCLQPVILSAETAEKLLKKNSSITALTPPSIQCPAAFSLFCLTLLSLCPQDLLENDSLHNSTDASGNPLSSALQSPHSCA
jgi:hypothetical protein